MLSRVAPLACGLAVAAGCGSGAPLPPAAEPAPSPPLDAEPAGRVTDAGRDARLPHQPRAARLADGATVEVDARRRRLVVEQPDGKTLSAPAGLGPTQVVVGADDRIYVTDTDGGAVLLFRRGNDHLGLVRRAAVPGKPYATAIDREEGKLWVTVTQTNEVVELTADGAPRIKARFPSVRQPIAIAVQDGRVLILGAGGKLQTLPADLDSRAG